MEPIPLSKEVVELITDVAVTFSVLYLTSSLLRIFCKPQNQDNTEVLEAIRDLKESMLEAISNIELKPLNQESEEESEEDSEEDSEEEPLLVETTKVEEVPAVEVDKHAILRQLLKEQQQVYVSYKKTTFAATYELKSSAPHGYVFKYNNVEYVTPTQFSYKMKKSLNPNLVSDNGWDTVYILDEANKKHSLKSLT